MIDIAIGLLAFSLAYANGANDVFKGVATLFGSRTASYGKGLTWALVFTLLGALCSFTIANHLAWNFSGRGLVPNDIATTPGFVIAVLVGAAAAVLAATFTGFPISTTHALVGGLVGAGWITVGRNLNIAMLRDSFLLPLVLSPVLSVFLAAALYRSSRFLTRRSKINADPCVCLEQCEEVSLASPDAAGLSLQNAGLQVIVAGKAEDCNPEQHPGQVVSLTIPKVLTGAHYLSAGAVSFARAVNDTPKIAALLLILQWIKTEHGVLLVALCMILGGLLSARRVAMTMSKKITPLNQGQGFTANIVTAGLVLAASLFGLPVSTTHVSVGSLSGIGLVTGEGNRRVMGEILSAWLLTLPLSALLSALTAWTMTHAL